MQYIYLIKLVITKVFITVIIICGKVYVSASLQDIKVRVSFETRHQHFAWKGFSMKKMYTGVKVIIFSPSNLPKRKENTTNYEVGSSVPSLVHPNEFWFWTIPSPLLLPSKTKSGIYPNYRKTPKIGYQIIHAFSGAPSKFWVNLFRMTTGVIFATPKSQSLCNIMF